MPFANLPDVKLHYEISGAEHLPVDGVFEWAGHHDAHVGAAGRCVFEAVSHASLRHARARAIRSYAWSLHDRAIELGRRWACWML